MLLYEAFKALESHLGYVSEKSFSGTEMCTTLLNYPALQQLAAADIR